MGGVIGRYALADMEADNETHDVRLFIAHDSPMQGANTPLSFQYFSRHALDEYVDAPILYGIGEVIVPTLISLTELLTLNNLSIPYASPLETLTIQDTPAAVQLNYSYVDILSNPISAINEQWQSELDAIGYPTQSRNIAISNGNECAVDHGFGPRAPFLEVHDDHNPDFFGDLLHLVVTPLIGAIASEYELVILGILPGSSKYFFDL
ncbi:hypothetical protein ES692_07670 [Psychroserpens burtonensis]|uniref:Uncharacterized protein n=1 Tax=Psychroserpens burtonensis TaxID=49278 RepID=A0A5C7BH78_9FLAO|nr:hypothetical protein [Psychroserpens burtonensis]TXE18112.1 hypothetical protein ES692_07670 [Psychroserpens burtonensis]